MCAPVPARRGGVFAANSAKKTLRTVTGVLTLSQRGCNRLHGNDTAGLKPPPWAVIPGFHPSRPACPGQGTSAGRTRDSLPRPSTQADSQLAVMHSQRVVSLPTFHLGDDPHE